MNNDSREFVSRSAVIDALKPIAEQLSDGLQSDIASAIMSTPSAYRWIPCSERMPHIYSRYLVTTKIFDNNVVEINIWDDEEQRWCWIGEVLAWMPLPEPWRGADND